MVLVGFPECSKSFQVFLECCKVVYISFWIFWGFSRILGFSQLAFANVW